MTFSLLLTPTNHKNWNPQVFVLERTESTGIKIIDLDSGLRMGMDFNDSVNRGEVTDSPSSRSRTVSRWEKNPLWK